VHTWFCNLEKRLCLPRVGCKGWANRLVLVLFCLPPIIRPKEPNIFFLFFSFNLIHFNSFQFVLIRVRKSLPSGTHTLPFPQFIRLFVPSSLFCSHPMVPSLPFLHSLNQTLLCACVCVCVCVWSRKGKQKEREIWQKRQNLCLFVQ
jgi:hypothetical protein